VESGSEPELLSEEEEEDDSELEEDEEEELELGDEPQSGSAARVRVRGPAAAAPSLFILRARVVRRAALGTETAIIWVSGSLIALG